MGLIRANQPLMVEISDFEIGSTKIKRKVRIESLTYSLRDTRVDVNVTIIPFADDAGEYGVPLDNVGVFSSRNKTISANMYQLIDLSTGLPFTNVMALTDQRSLIPAHTKVITPAVYDTDGVTVLKPEATEEVPDGILVGKDYMYEFEYYRQIAGTQSLIVDNMLTQIVERYDNEGQFDN